MNFKLKALVAAAVVASTMSGAANAIPANDLFLVAVDTAGHSFIADLGLVSAFSNTTPFTPRDFAAISGDTNWSTFIAGTTAANVQYQVLGWDGANSIYSTSTDMVDPAGSNLEFNNLLGQFGAGGSFTNFLAANTGSTNYVASSASTASGAGIGNNWTQAFSNFTTTATLGSNNYFYNIAKTSTGNIKPLTLNPFTQPDATNSFWKLSTAGVLTYSTAAAVPEADTSAMILMGLGLMGFIARRRRA
jgi:hypothetical protein